MLSCTHMFTSSNRKTRYYVTREKNITHNIYSEANQPSLYLQSKNFLTLSVWCLYYIASAIPIKGVLARGALFTGRDFTLRLKRIRPAWSRTTQQSGYFVTRDTIQPIHPLCLLCVYWNDQPLLCGKEKTSQVRDSFHVICFLDKMTRGLILSGTLLSIYWEILE